MESTQVEQSILAITRAIGTDIAYLENDNTSHFDPVSAVAGLAALLLGSFLEGARDAAKDGGKRVGMMVTEKIAGLFSTKSPSIPDSTGVLKSGRGVQQSDLERYGDVAESLVAAALVKNGLPLRKANVVASKVRAEADRIVAQPSS